MSKQNCWEFKNCGREPGGAKTGDLGVCPAATEQACDGVNTGANGGRACWVIAGTLCGGTVQGAFASKLANCMECGFYGVVAKEEGTAFVKSEEIKKLFKK